MSIEAVALIAWIPVCVALFAICRPVRAVTLAYLVGWLLLPTGGVPIEGFLDIDKTVAIGLGVMVGIALFRTRELSSYKFGTPDFLLLFFSVSTAATSILNELGVYDGISSLIQKLLTYGVPFFSGRIFIRSRRDLYEAAWIIVIGAAFYTIPTIWEWRMSPQLHRMAYGYHQHALITTVRWGFSRPVVFFTMALGLGIFFAWTSLLAIGLYRANLSSRGPTVRQLAAVFLPLIGLATSMSFGPYGLFLIGFMVLQLTFRYRRKLPLCAPLIFAVIWMGGRYGGLTDGEWMSSAIAQVSQKRAHSMQYRVDAETAMLRKARERPMFGWGGWDRFRTTNEVGKQWATDGLWLIFVSSYGLVGLTAFYAWWCWPILMTLMTSYDLRKEPIILALLAGIGLQTVNFLFNGFISPVLILVSGGVVSVLAQCKHGALNARSHLEVRYGVGRKPMVGKNRLCSTSPS